MKQLGVSLIGIFLFATFMFFALGTSPSSAADKTPVPAEGGNFYFDRDRGAIVDCDSSVTKAAVPAAIDGIAVTSIEAGAFEGCTALEQIELADSIETIGENAFDNCISLKKAVLPEKVTRIEQRLFNYCSGLESVTFQGGITAIESCAFIKCTSLKEINWPQTLESIGDHAFWGCAVSSVTLPESVAQIEWGAFYECKNLKKIVLPSGLKDIPGMCFAQCDLLTEVGLGNEVQTVGYGAFQECKSLKEIDLPDSVKKLGRSAFSGCRDLEKVVLPKRMEQWDEYVFQGCERLSKMAIPKGIETIDKYSFYGCKNLTEVTAPEGVKSIGNSAFGFCDGLRKITLPQSIENIDDDAFGGMDYNVFTVYGYRWTPAEMITWQFVNLGSAWTVDHLTGYQDRNGTAVLKWDKRPDAKGYAIYRKERNGSYEMVGETVQPSYRDLDIALGAVYDYKVKPYRDSGTRRIQGDDRVVTVVIKDFTGNRIPQWEYTKEEADSSKYAPKQIQAAAKGARAVKLTWTSDEAQNHFYVYRSSSANGKYTYVGQYLNGYKAAQFTDNGVKAGKTYYYRIKPAVELKWSKPVKAKAVPDRPLLKIKGLRGKKAKITWKKVSGADGYYVYRAENKNGKYKKIKTLKRNQTSFTDKRLKKKHYYYKVKAYDKVGKKRYASSYSNIGHVKRASKGYYK